MGILIRIRKYYQKNDVVYYKVHGEDYGGTGFYMSINKTEKKIQIYQSIEFNAPIYEIDLEDLSSKIQDIPGVISARMMAHVFVKSYKAFEKDEFPEYLDYAA